MDRDLAALTRSEKRDGERREELGVPRSAAGRKPGRKRRLLDEEHASIARGGGEASSVCCAPRRTALERGSLAR
jgi:hypothetical protein